MFPIAYWTTHSFLFLLALLPNRIGCQYGNASFLAPPNPKACANSGRFLGIFCLGDFNCHGGRPGSRQVCIRGRCCTKTRTAKSSVNRRTAEDRGCPVGTFYVGISCTRTEDCMRRANMLLLSVSAPLLPFPLLECARQSGRCCTSSKYRKPLTKGAACLNGGTATGKGNCVSHLDCKTAQRRWALCVDGQCCSRAVRKPGNAGGGSIGTMDDDGLDLLDDDLDGDGNGMFGDSNSEFDAEDDDDGLLDWNDEEDVNNVGDDGQQYSEDDNGQNNVRGNGNRALQQGRQICRRYGLAYRQVRRCSRQFGCGNRQRFRCISGHCCMRQSINGNYDGFADDDGSTSVVIGAGSGGRPGQVPADAGGYCLGAGRFRRFLGQFCRSRAQCPRALDAQRRVVSIRCVRGACCAALRRQIQIGTAAWDKEEGDNRGGGGLLPVRPRGAFAFCFDGTLSRRQCHSALDCPVPQRQSCVNGLCCAPTMDQERYACGGIASAGQCTASTSMHSSAGCRDRLYCLSPGACCECRQGRPQAGVSDCRRRRAVCKSGFACDQASGFCCPQCPEGRMPFGSCYLGKCARGFACRPGNICCERSAVDDDDNDVDAAAEDYKDNADAMELDYNDYGGIGMRRRTAGRGGGGGGRRRQQIAGSDLDYF